MRVWGRMARAIMGAAMLMATAWPAQAAWVRVETDKFIVYGQGGERAVAAYATKLNTYDAVLRRFHPSTLDRKPDTKVQVFMVSSRDDLRRVRPRLNRNIAGFYSAMNEGVFAMALKDGGLGEDDVMFHEYAHHFMWENFPAAYPAWFVEGWAEYFMTTDIKPAEIKIGGYNTGRAYGIFGETWIPLEDLLSKTSFETREQKRDVYYSLAWLLMLYMRSDPERAAQLDTAIRAIAEGEDPVKSFEAATGRSMEDLTQALKKYRRLQILGIKNPGVAVPMKITTLSRSADDLLLDNLRLAMSVFLNGSVRDAQKLLEEKARFRDLEHAYSATHLARLSDNTVQSIETSSLHIDLISELKRINSLLCSVAYPILESAGALAPSRLRAMADQA